MRHIRTTATAVEKLKHEAKQLRKTGTSLTMARELVSKRAGYVNWKHVTVCASATGAEFHSRPLPAVVIEFLAGQATAPISDEARLNLDSGIVFSMDIKDAQNIVLGDGVAEFDEVMPLVAGDLLRAYFDEDDKPDDEADPGALLQECLEHLSNYRLFRYGGARTGSTLDHAFSDVLGRFFFAPHHVWLDGHFTNMADVKEVRVNGKVIYSTTGQADGLGVSNDAKPDSYVARPTSGTAASDRRGHRQQDPHLEDDKRPSAKERSHVENVTSELFDRPELRALLTGDIVSLHSSAAGGVFAMTLTGERPSVDATDALSRHVLPKMVEVLQGVGCNGTVLEADIRVGGMALCLSVMLPPVSRPSSWSITRRSHVMEDARKPILLDLFLQGLRPSSST